eukprot:COSAG03_NODE_25678_length_264_cov_0.624242_1_plen_74_part_10
MAALLALHCWRAGAPVPARLARRVKTARRRQRGLAAHAYMPAGQMGYGWWDEGSTAGTAALPCAFATSKGGVSD